MEKMATNINKKTQTMMRLCYPLMKKNNEATRVKMRMIKDENRKNQPLKKIKITTYHFEEEK